MAEDRRAVLPPSTLMSSTSPVLEMLTSMTTIPFRPAVAGTRLVSGMGAERRCPSIMAEGTKVPAGRKPPAEVDSSATARGCEVLREAGLAALSAEEEREGVEVSGPVEEMVFAEREEVAEGRPELPELVLVSPRMLLR